MGGFPVSEEHAAGGLDSLTGDPEIVVRQQGSDHAADIVGQADAPKGNLRSDEFVDVLSERSSSRAAALWPVFSICFTTSSASACLRL
jgi:hypothetical protein